MPAPLPCARGVDDAAWLDIVEQHHESLNGSGYPAGLQGEAICREAQVIAVADRYCGMISERAYRPGIAPGLALKEIHAKHGGALDPALIGLLVKSLGLYPPGTLVVLANGEFAAVTGRLLDVMHPVVHALCQNPKQPYDVPRKRLTGSQRQLDIDRVITREAVPFAIDPDQLWPPAVEDAPGGASV